MSVRFAPSPTGTFHLGNLRTAWISHQLARELGLSWIVRFEDIDQPRVVQGAMEGQLEDLSALGLRPDQVLVQSAFHSRHETLFRRAVDQGRIYPCTCSRKEISDTLRGLASAPHEGSTGWPIYSGRCRDPKERRPKRGSSIAWRFLSDEDSSGSRDFIVARSEAEGHGFVPSYHWACAIDDHDGNHTLLVRAWDLAHVLPQQRAIFEWVAEIEGHARPNPAVFHASLVVQEDGHRLEKRTRGVTLAELLARGVAADAILKHFEKSFDRALIASFAPGKIWGEALERIKLGELGFGKTRGES